MTIKLIAASQHIATATAENDSTTLNQGVVEIANTEDASTVALEGVTRIDLCFPKFTDGRAYSQAFMLRRKGFKGEIRATGDVLIDQLVQMQRMGFDAAVLRADQNPEFAQKQFDCFAAFYQGDAVTPSPQFARSAA